MKFLVSLRPFASALFRRSRVETEMDEELRAHIQDRASDLERSGLRHAEAQRQARLDFGGYQKFKEECREALGTHLIDTLLQDIRYGLRTLRKSPGFTLVAVLTLALGIGANTAIFSVVDAVLLRPLPYPHSNRLVVIWQTDAEHRSTGAWFDTYSEFQEYQRYSHSFEKMAAATWAPHGETVLLWQGKPRQVMAIPVSADFFSMLDARAAHGRTFEPQDLSNPCTVVLANGFWHAELGATDVVGRTVTLNGTPCTVAGIMPASFSFYPKQTQLWTLITPDSQFAKDPWNSMVGVFGLLKPGVTRAAALSELTSLHHQIVRQAPPDSVLSKAFPVILDLQFNFTWLAGRNLRTSLVVLFAAVVFILLIACVNVATLLLGRASQRQKELGIRAALGSGRLRIIRQLLAESLLLSLAGALAGTVLALAAVRYFNATSPVELPPGNPLTVNWLVLAFTLAIALASTLVFGLFPAWRASHVDLNEVLKESSRGLSGQGTRRGAGKFFVVAEAALSLTLLAGAALLIESLAHLDATPLGFQPDHLLTANLDFPPHAYSDAAQRLRLFEQLKLGIRALPGVTGVAYAPLVSHSGSPLIVAGKPAPAEGSPGVSISAASSEYFSVAGIPLLQGREFNSRDQSDSAPVAIINEAVAKLYFPHNNPVGRRIKLGAPEDKAPWLTVVGVVGDVKSFTVFKEMGYVVVPSVFLPLTQQQEQSIAIFVRTAGDPRALVPAIRNEFLKIEPSLPPPDLLTMNDWLAQFRTQPRFRTILLGIFAALALLLCGVGIYGVVSQSVAQRQHEIGIRVALGAERHNILKMILGQSLRLTLVGVLIGAAMALILARALSSFSQLLYGVSASDPLTLLAVSCVLGAVTALGCYIPARRAMRVDPIAALRHE